VGAVNLYGLQYTYNCEPVSEGHIMLARQSC